MTARTYWPAPSLPLDPGWSTYEQGGYVPSTADLKRQHLEELHRELDELKAHAQQQALEQEWLEQHPEDGHDSI